MTGEDKERTNNITVGIKWLKEHGFHRDTRCREARAAANPPGEAWKRGFEIDVLNWHYLDRRRFYMVVFQYKGEWMADFGKTAHWYSSEGSEYVQGAIHCALEKFMRWRMAKISELSDERLAAASIRKQLLGTNL